MRRIGIVYRLVCGVLLSGLAITPARAQVQLIHVTPERDTTVGMPVPEFTLEFSGAIDPSSATAETIRLFRIGTEPMTPGPDDTAVPLTDPMVENGDTLVRMSPTGPLADGDYALVVFANPATRSGPGSGLKFSYSSALLDVDAFKTLGETYTLEAWVRFDNWSTYGDHTYGAIFDVGTSGRHVPGFWLAHVRDDVHFGYYVSDNSQAYTVASGALAKGEWRHVAAVISSAGSAIYVNGELAASMPETIRPDSISDDIEVALSGYSRWAGSYDYVLGMFDEMRVWNVARTPDEIKRTMYTPLSGHEPGLLLYHPFDDDKAGVLVDETGHGYDGNPNGTPHDVSNAPIMELPGVFLAAADESPVDVFADGSAGGVRVLPFHVDTTPPRVVAFQPNVTDCSLIRSVSSIAITFDDDMDVSTLTVGNASLTAAVDGTFGNGDDLEIALPDPVYDETDHTLTFDLTKPLPDGHYRFTLSDAVKNVAGLALDGEFPGTTEPDSRLPSGDGVAGGAFSIGWTTVIGSPDCNNNGVVDACELDGNDCNGNLVPDECDLDCNDNGSPDDCDVLDGISPDCNGNGIPDECDARATASALDFDGSGDWVRVPHSPLLEPTDELTVEAWLRPDSAGSPNNSRIIRTAGPGAAGYILSWRQSGASKLELRIDSAANGACRATDPTPVENYFGTWIHVAGVYSASQGLCRLYVNGELKADEPDAGTLRYSNSDLFIGSFPGGEDFDGLIDEVRIWNVARTNDELITSMNHPLLGIESGLVGYWRFDEGGGQVAFDSSPYANDGQLGADTSPLGDSRDPRWVKTVAPLLYGDCNENGTLDACDIADGVSGDCNSNGLPDECESDADCNSNGVQDFCDLAAGTSADCDQNGVPDDCEPDANGDGVPDACDALGDFNHDGYVDLSDYSVFVICLNLSGPDVAPPFTECLDAFDATTSGTVDLRDVAAFQRAFRSP